MDSKTRQAVMWLMERPADEEPKRTAVEAARKFGLSQANGISVALRAYKAKLRDQGIADVVTACQSLYDNFIASGGDPNSVVAVQARTSLANMADL